MTSMIWPSCFMFLVIWLVNTTSACDVGWRGHDCSELALDGNGSKAYPANGSFDAHAWEDRPYPWGGDCLVAEDGLYHCFFTEFMEHCPMTYGTWYSSTVIRHAVSAFPTGPYEPLDVAIPKAAGNPVLLKRKTPDGYYVMYFTNQRFDQPVRSCIGRNSSSWHSEAVYNLKKLHGDVPMGVNVAWSRSLSGPWAVRYDIIAKTVPLSTNPGVVLLPNGTVVLAYKTWPSSAMCRSFVRADSCKAIGLLSTHTNGWNASYDYQPTGGQFVAVSRDVEDPSIYRDPISGILHMVLHVEGAGGSAHSFDNGSSWHFNSSAHSYEYGVTVSNGSRLYLSNREEPKILLDAQGAPTHLINSAVVRSLKERDTGGPAGSGYEGLQSTFLTFVLMQPLAGSQLRKDLIV